MPGRKAQWFMRKLFYQETHCRGRMVLSWFTVSGCKTVSGTIWLAESYKGVVVSSSRVLFSSQEVNATISVPKTNKYFIIRYLVEFFTVRGTIILPAAVCWKPGVKVSRSSRNGYRRAKSTRPFAAIAARKSLATRHFIHHSLSIAHIDTHSFIHHSSH